MDHLAQVLAHYGIEGKVTGVVDGPLVKQIVFLPKEGTKLKNIMTVLPDVAREFGAASLRVEPVEGSAALGFELPADEPKTVDFAEIDFAPAKGALPLCFGVDIKGAPVFADLAKMPHLLVAGTTGSGKSVGLNTFILSLIKTHKPANLKLVLIDPKRIEFSIYNNQKYLFCPVVTESSEAAAVLDVLVQEMEKRYQLFEENMVRNISEYNESAGHLPYIVCVIDEFAELMAAQKSAAAAVQRLAQKARAAGIHIILATQRPSVDVVTGVLKANFPTRLAYKVASGADSRTILDAPGAENLIGRGDALFLAADGSLKRVHGAYASDAEIAAVLEPYRAKVPALKTTDTPKPVSQPQKSWVRRIWEWWTSLRQKDKKVIYNIAAYLAGIAVGRAKRK